MLGQLGSKTSDDRRPCDVSNQPLVSAGNRADQIAAISGALVKFPARRVTERQWVARLGRFRRGSSVSVGGRTEYTLRGVSVNRRMSPLLASRVAASDQRTML